MGADAHHRAVVDHDDLVDRRDRRNPLRDDDYRRRGRDLPQSGAHVGVGVDVERRERVVEQVDRGSADHRPGDRQPLPLAAGEVDAALGHAHVQTVGVGGDERVGRRDAERLPHLVVGRVGLAVAQVLGDRAREEEAALGHQPDRRPQRIDVVVANVDAVHGDRARGDVEQPADQRDERRLARTRRPHHGIGGAWPGGERNALQHGPIRAGIAERRTRDLEHPQHGVGLGGLRRADDCRRRGQHLGDAFGAHRGARQHHQQDRGHQHGHQDLHEVGQERDQRPDLHLAGVDAQAAEPDERHAGHVDHQGGDRQQQRLQSADRQCGVGQRAVGLAEAGPLERLPGERPDDANARELFAQHAIDAVDEALHGAVDRQQSGHDPVVGQPQHRHADHQQPGQPGILVQRHRDAPDAHDGRGDQHRARHLQQHLNLLDVVGGAGQQRRRTEPGGLLGRQPGDVVEHRRPQIPAEAHAHAGAEVDRADRTQHLQRGDAEHHGTKLDDGVGVTPGYAVVDDLRVDGRQVERSQRADDLEGCHDDDRRAVGPGVPTQQAHEHSATVPHRGGQRLALGLPWVCLENSWSVGMSVVVLRCCRYSVGRDG